MTALFAAVSGLNVLVAGGCATTELAALREVDRALTSAKSIEEFLPYVSEDCTIFPPHSPPVVGRKAIREFWRELYSNPGFALQCQLGEAQAARGGDFGYTTGTYALTLDDAAGKAVTDRGKYVTIWKKRAGGQWKMVVDIWNTSQPAR